MSKSRRIQRSAGRNTNNYEYKKEVSCKDNYLSDKHKEAREEFIKNNPIVPMNPKQRKYVELLEDKNVFQKTTSGVMSEQGEPNFVFYVFDDFTHHNLPYSERADIMRYKLDTLTDRIKFLGQNHVS